MLGPRRKIFRNVTQKFIEMAGLTDVGSVRQYNEDSIAIDPENAAIVVAAGMGGHRAGEVASRIATEVIFNELKSYIPEFGNAASQLSPRLAIEQSIKRANKSVYEAAQANAAYGLYGTADEVGKESRLPAGVARVPSARLGKIRFPGGRIKILAGKRAGSIVELDRVVATLGKRGDRLAVLTRRPHGYFITHVEGRRCPRVNGQSVGKEARMLQNGDIIEFADEKLQFLME